MSSYSNFQSQNAKNKNDRYDIYNSAFNSSVEAKGQVEVDNFTKNLDKYSDFVSWAR